MAANLLRHDPRAHPGRSSRRALAAALAALATLLPASGCVTAAVWEELPDHDADGLDWDSGGTIGAIALTPVTVAVDAALIAGWLWLIAEGDGCGCGGDSFVIDFD